MFRDWFKKWVLSLDFVEKALFIEYEIGHADGFEEGYDEGYIEGSTETESEEAE